MKRNRKRCYHWVIAGVALLVMFVQLGIVNNLVGLYIVRSPSPWGSPGPGSPWAFPFGL